MLSATVGGLLFIGVIQPIYGGSPRLCLRRPVDQVERLLVVVADAPELAERGAQAVERRGRDERREARERHLLPRLPDHSLAPRLIADDDLDEIRHGAEPVLRAAQALA